MMIASMYFVIFAVSLTEEKGLKPAVGAVAPRAVSVGTGELVDIMVCVGDLEDEASGKITSCLIKS